MILYPSLALLFSFAWIAIIRIIGCPTRSIRIGKVIVFANLALLPVFIASLPLDNSSIVNGAILCLTTTALQTVLIRSFAQVPGRKAFIASLLMNAITYRFWITCSINAMVLHEVVRTCLTLPTCIVLSAAAADLFKINLKPLLSTLSVGFTAALMAGSCGVLIYSRRFWKMCILFVGLLELLIKHYRSKEGLKTNYALLLRDCTLAALPFLVNFWLHEAYFAAESRQLHNWVQGLMTTWFLILPVIVLGKSLILRYIVRWGSFGRCCTDALLMTLLGLSLVGVDPSFGDSGLIMRIVGVPHGDFSVLENLERHTASLNVLLTNDLKLILFQSTTLVWLRKQNFLCAFLAAAITDTYFGIGFVLLFLPAVFLRQVPGWYQQSAKANESRGKLLEAYELLKTAIRAESIFPGNCNPWLGNMYLAIGNVALRRGNTADAETKYKFALSNYINTYGYFDDSLMPSLLALKNISIQRQNHMARDWYDHWLKTIERKVTTDAVSAKDKAEILARADNLLTGDYKVVSTLQLYAKLSVLMILPIAILISITAWWVPEYFFRVTKNISLFERCIEFQRPAIGSDEWYR
ncbi:MAG: hypothetical protein K2Y22_03815 [Candidatus Obscuribacterales bacterium]|nr:hypothetical protein [Candidatus Obscuribacterales bacterium]